MATSDKMQNIVVSKSAEGVKRESAWSRSFVDLPISTGV